MVFNGFKSTKTKKSNVQNTFENNHQHNATQKKCTCSNIDTLRTGQDSFSGFLKEGRNK